MFLVSFAPKPQNSFASSPEYIIINSAYSNIYKSSDFTQKYDFKFNSHEKLLLLGEENDFYKIQFNFTNTPYVGYIPFEFASVYQEPAEVIVEFNAKVLTESEILSTTSNDVITDVKLKAGHRVFLYEGFKSKEEYNKIKFIHNNKVYTGRILTTNIAPDGVNKALIIGLSAIVAIVGVTLILLGLKSKKKKKKEIKLRREHE